MAKRVTIVNGQNFEKAAGLTGSVLVAQCDNRFVLSDIKLSINVDQSHPWLRFYNA